MTISRDDLYGNADSVRAILKDATLWFIVGLGDNPDRPAYSVAKFLQSHGYRIVPVHPMGREVHGEKGYRTLAEAAAAEGVPDVVDVFVNSDRAGEVVDAAMAIGAPTIWLQLHVIDEAAAERAVTAGVRMVMDQCPAQVWAALDPTR